jgi:hypothetical protein
MFEERQVHLLRLRNKVGLKARAAKCSNSQAPQTTNSRTSGSSSASASVAAVRYSA